MTFVGIKRELIHKYEIYRSKKARKRNMTTWEYPLKAGYTFYDDPVTEWISQMSDEHADFKKFNSIIKEVKSYDNEYENFCDIAIQNGYSVYMKIPNGYKKMFTFDYNSRKLFEVAKIGFDSGIFVVADRNDYKIKVPKAPKNKYDYYYSEFSIKRNMAYTAERIYHTSGEDREYYQKKHEQLCKDLAMLHQRINPDVIRFRDTFGLDFDYEYIM